LPINPRRSGHGKKKKREGGEVFKREIEDICRRMPTCMKRGFPGEGFERRKQKDQKGTYWKESGS